MPCSGAVAIPCTNRKNRLRHGDAPGQGTAALLCSLVVIALHAAIRDGDLVARPSFWQTTQVRKSRARGEPAHLTVHEDCLAFRRPEVPDAH
jgi:hypothetical protein